MKVITNQDLKIGYNNELGKETIEAVQNRISDKLLKEKEEKSTKSVIRGGGFKLHKNKTKK